MSTTELGHFNLSLAETLPKDVSFLDDYQEQAFQQIKWDDTGGTIKGMLPRDYMLAGLLEEIDEMIVDIDRVEPDYSRMGALVMLEGNEALMPGQVTETSVERHLKEFGDVSWYLANYLRQYNLQFSRTIAVGEAAWALNRLSQPRSTWESTGEVEQTFPWIHLFSASGELKDAAQSIVNVPRDMRILPEQALLVASGKLVTSMTHLAATRFNTSYGDILTGNQKKLAKRLQDGTIFDKSGGDDR